MSSEASTSNNDACYAKWEMELRTADYLPVLREAQNGGWARLQARLERGHGLSILKPDTKISMFSENIIHVIVCLGGRGSTALLESIVNDPIFDNKILRNKEIGGNTALFFAAMVGNLEAAKIMVAKDPEVLNRSDLDKDFPVYIAARFGHKETTRYLIDQMIERQNHNFEDNDWGVLLVNLLITADIYDMASELIDKFPKLAYGKDKYGVNPLQTFSNRPLSGNHADALKLIRRICEALCLNAKMERQTASDFLWAPLLKATKLGTYEIVKEIVDACPYIIWFTDEYERTIFHQAVIHRHERIFNLIWNMGANKHRITEFTSINGTNILHLAGLLGTTTASRVSGAALQMQRELQWFKDEEIDKVDEYEDLRGTPRMVFTSQHKDLLKEGTEWMKTTATAYTIVTALIVTVLFAAAFTLPGGIDDKTSIPNFLHKPSFIVFSVANAIGLSSSSTSLMMFLGILTSRYSENDFLLSLPRKLVIGLVALYISILCMLVAFSAALYINLVNLSKLVLIPIIVCPCIPGILFMFLQFPLLYEVFYSTYGPSIFRQERKSLKTIPTDAQGRQLKDKASKTNSTVVNKLGRIHEDPSTETNDVIVDLPQQFEDEDIEARRQLKGKAPAEDQREEEPETSYL